MNITKTFLAASMAAMLLVSATSCDKDDDNKTEEQSQNPEQQDPEPQNVEAINAAIISKKAVFPSDGSIQQILRSEQFKDFTSKVAKFANNAAVNIEYRRTRQ